MDRDISNIHISGGEEQEGSVGDVKYPSAWVGRLRGAKASKRDSEERIEVKETGGLLGIQRERSRANYSMDRIYKRSEHLTEEYYILLKIFAAVWKVGGHNSVVTS